MWGLLSDLTINLIVADLAVGVGQVLLLCTEYLVPRSSLDESDIGLAKGFLCYGQ